VEHTTLAVAHLRLRLRAVNDVLRGEVRREAAIAAMLDVPGPGAQHLTERHAQLLLDRVDAFAESVPLTGHPGPIADEDPGEEALREAARAMGHRLPLELLGERYRLGPFEQDALVLVAAPELHSAYERLYGYALDDLNRGQPCVELLARLGAGTAAETVARLQLLGPSGNLRRTGLLLPVGEAPTEARQELRLAPGLVAFLLGGRSDLAVVARDEGAAAPPDGTGLPPHVDPDAVARLAARLRAGSVGVVGVWGTSGGHREVVAHLTAGTSLRHLALARLPAVHSDVRETVRGAIRTAAGLGAILWVDVGPAGSPDDEIREAALAQEISASSVPVCLTGPAPWRIPEVLARRPYAEVLLREPTLEERRRMWDVALCGTDPIGAARLAARFRLSYEDVTAAVKVARAEADPEPGAKPQLNGEVEWAATIVAQRRTARLGLLEHPDRPPDDLVLPPEQHRQVLEVAAFFDGRATVDDGWGFGNLPGGRGLTVLFTGDPGTGKTLAAEVVAARLGLALLRTDLSRLVSKWVGETEKNLDAAFDEAEACNAVLFFDEADALFGRRGEIERGTDRWANVEVGFLLQRLERFEGLAILSSNLKENIDPAFTRRFDVIIHFPRPARDDRRRLWRFAFPASAPVSSDLDLEALADLDLTGAAIVAAARTSALLAADANHDEIGMRHVVQAVARQYQREARVLRPTELGLYADLVGS
jgi:hypothetical protein